MSPQIRPRASSNLSEGRRKLALKFRKKKQEAKTDSQKEDSASPLRKEEDIDEIFKSYEEENARNLSNSSGDSCGVFTFVSIVWNFFSVSSNVSFSKNTFINA